MIHLESVSESALELERQNGLLEQINSSLLLVAENLEKLANCFMEEKTGDKGRP